MDKLSWARQVFYKDRFATEAAGIEITQAEKGRAVCVMPLLPRHKNADGQVMGGATFTLADFAFAIAVNEEGASPAVTLSSQIQFMNTAKGDTLIAEAICIKDGKRSCVAEVTVKDNLARLVAKAIITGLHT